MLFEMNYELDSNGEHQNDTKAIYCTEKRGKDYAGNNKGKKTVKLISEKLIAR